MNFLNRLSSCKMVVEPSHSSPIPHAPKSTKIPEHKKHAGSGQAVADRRVWAKVDRYLQGCCEEIRGHAAMHVVAVGYS